MDWWDQSTYSHWIGGYTSVSGSISIAKFTRTENNCNSAEANAQMCAMCTQHKTVCFFAKHSISLYVLAFRLHSLQFNVSRFHLINIRLFVHIRSHSCTSATTSIQINPAGRKFCPNFWAKTQYSYKNCFGLWQFLTDCVVIFTETNLFEYDFDVSFPLAFPSWCNIRLSCFPHPSFSLVLFTFACHKH